METIDFNEKIRNYIIEDYKSWLNNSSGNVNYASYLPKAFEYMASQKNNPPSDVELNFLDIYPKLLVSGCKEKIAKLIEFIRCTICKYEWKRDDNNRSADSCKTSLTTFLQFIEKESKNLKNKLINDFSLENFKLSTEQEKSLDVAFKNRIIYTHKELMEKWKSRLGSQNRTSGDKVWLPLTFIAKLFNPKGQRGRNYTNDYIDWLKSMTNNVCVHYWDEKDEKVKFAKFKNTKLYLEFTLDSETKEYEVNVIISKKGQQGECHKALTPTGKGNNKEFMKVKDIDAISIDHVKPIDKTLKEKEFSCLATITEKYKEVKDPNNTDDINMAVEKLLNEIDDIVTMKKQLLDELKSISDDSPLRLMASKYNSQKSNGDTFPKIIRLNNEFKSNEVTLGKGSLLGVLEENVVIRNESGEPVFLVQELKDNILQNEYKVLTVMPTGNPITGRKSLEKNLNYI